MKRARARSSRSPQRPVSGCLFPVRMSYSPGRASASVGRSHIYLFFFSSLSPRKVFAKYSAGAKCSRELHRCGGIAQHCERHDRRDSERHQVRRSDLLGRFRPKVFTDDLTAVFLSLPGPQQGVGALVSFSACPPAVLPCVLLTAVTARHFFVFSLFALFIV